MSVYYLIAAVVIAYIGVITVTRITGRRKLTRILKQSYGRAPTKKYDEYVMKSISSYWDHKKQAMDATKTVDDQTWHDLDFDSIYKRLNASCSSVGEEFLYSALREQEYSPERASKLERAIQYFDQNPEARLKTQLALARLGRVNSNGITEYFYNPSGKVLRNHLLYPALAIAAVLAIVLVFIDIKIGLLLLVAMAVTNLYVYHQTKLYVETELTSVRYISSLILCAGRLSRLKGESEIGEYAGRLGKLQAPLKRMGRLAGTIMGGSYADIDFISEYLKMFFMVDFLLYHSVVKAISRHDKACIEIYEIIGFLDMAVSISSYRKSLKFYCAPEFTDTDEIVMTDLVHPLLTNAVANSVTFRKGSLITGSNASGKSTFVKALAVNIILAQSVNTCLAKEFRLRPSFVITSMAINDDLQGGDSYYIAEIRSLKRIIDNLSENTRCLCFIDEILRGTNTIERIAASAAVLDTLKRENCLAVVATHDIELTEMAQADYDNYHFQEQVSDDGITFDYRIYEGRATTKNAIKLLEFMGYREEIVKKANALAAHFERERSWEKL